MKVSLLLVAHMILCAALFYAVFCRTAMTSEASTRREIRLILTMEGTIAAFGMALPLAYGYRPSLFSVCLLLAIVVPKLALAKHWSNGVPKSCLKDPVHG